MWFETFVSLRSKYIITMDF